MTRYLKQSIFVAALISPILVVVAIWAPVWKAFHIEDIEISNEIVKESAAFPSNDIFYKLKTTNFGNPLSESELLNIERIADQAILGNLILENYRDHVVNATFDKRALNQGNSSWRLAYSSFLVPRILLEAYVKTDRDEFLEAALEFILDWELFERKIWSPEGFLWNDHAVAARANVIANFWYHYKSHPSFSMGDGKRVLRLAARQTRFLARDLNYTYKTNHGTMQNIAILKMALFFPKVKPIQEATKIAVDNLVEQFRYFINEEGVVLEHSAEYHAFGLSLISETVKIFRLLEVQIPKELAEKYQLGLGFLKALRRPDGGLPKLGDTADKFDSVGESLVDLETFTRKISDWRPGASISLKPKAGYAVWWSGLGDWPSRTPLSQLAITWSYFPFMGHKHADELSFNLWRGGREWWTSVGYWPYPDYRRDQAISWSGSNAPHLLRERKNSERKSKIVAHAENSLIKFLELSRMNKDGLLVRRQLIEINGSVWIVLDSFQDRQERTAQVVWGLHPDLRSTPSSARNSYRIKDDRTKQQMEVLFLGAEGMKVETVHGRENPFAGWMAAEQGITTSDAFIVNQKSINNWLAMISIFGEVDDFTDATAKVTWREEDHWSININYERWNLIIDRNSTSISVEGSYLKSGSEYLELKSVSDAEQNQNKVIQAYSAAEQKHGKRFLPLTKYREKISSVLAVLFVINAMVLFFLRRKGYLVYALSLIFFWSVHFWLVRFYFVV